MAKVVITQDLKDSIDHFLEENRPAELINTYLFFIQIKFNIQPVLFVRDKIIFQSMEDAIKRLEG